MRKRMLLCVAVFIMLLCITTACGQKKTTNTPIEESTQIDKTVIGESGKRYEMDTSSALNEDTENESFHEYSKLQETLKKIIEQTN